VTKQETVEKEGRFPTTLSTKSREQMLTEAKTFFIKCFAESHFLAHKEYG
jgi:hypothetical protein